MTDTPHSVADIAIFDTQTLKHPYHAYQRLRDDDPVHFVPSLGIHVVMRYDLVREAIRDTATYSSRFDGFLQTGQQMLFAAAPEAVKAELIRINREMLPTPPTMLTLDEPDHTQYRSLVAKLFTASEIRKSEAAVQATIDAAIARFAAHDGPGRLHARLRVSGAAADHRRPARHSCGRPRILRGCGGGRCCGTATRATTARRDGAARTTRICFFNVYVDDLLAQLRVCTHHVVLPNPARCCGSGSACGPRRKAFVQPLDQRGRRTTLGRGGGK